MIVLLAFALGYVSGVVTLIAYTLWAFANVSAYTTEELEQAKHHQERGQT